ncbi:MAG: NUDIX hydrolase [candidate division Zixibacteria bacterium]|nr:NUDIX hydrolase [candidate division Zixibacteria bacterium]
MAFVSQSQLDEVIERYGEPETSSFRIESTPEEVARIQSSQKHGRNHDVTVYAIKDDRIIVIAKHFYPPELYRAPSGGIKPGESIEAGALREMWEETGCRVELERFLLMTDAVFTSGENSVEWRSFVFLARYVEGDFEFTDTDEIRSVTLVDWSDFETFGRIMRRTDIGGLHYRAALHETVAELMGR